MFSAYPWVGKSFCFKIQFIDKHDCNPTCPLHLQPIIKMFNTQYNYFKF